MRFKMFLLGAAAIVATSANATDWTGFSGTITEGYDYSDVKGISNNTYGVGGAVNYAIPDTHLNVQGLVGYSENRSRDAALDTWTSGGAVTWRDANYAVGFAGSYNSSRLLGHSASYGNYGLVGEYYATPDLTVRLRGGGISGGFGALNGDGGYYGGGATYYVTPRLSVTADGSYATLSGLHWSSFEVGPDYLPFEGVPLSLGAAYTHDTYNSYGRSLNSDGVMVRLSWHLGDGTSLVDFDRNGPLNLHNPQLPTDGLTYAANYPLAK